MIEKISEKFGILDLDEFENYNDKTNSKIDYKRSVLNVSRDFSWIPVLEETLPYLDTIIRNPKKFLQQEEDIVIVEKSKKISTETIQHLAQHTNYIQDVDDDGMVMPSKVLNIEKEDSWDLYENRFIYTLVKELSKFVSMYANKDLEYPKTEINKVVDYNSLSTYENEEINVNLNITTTKREEPKDFDMESMKKKINDICDIIYGFEKSELIQSLSNAVPVKSPIKKTNIILKDVNFQKCLALWEFIKNTELGLPQEVKASEEDLSSKELKEKFDITNYLDYNAITNLTNNNDFGKDSLEDKLLSLIEEYVDITNYTEKRISDLITNEVKSAVKKRKIKYNDIRNIYIRYINSNSDIIKNICDIM